MAAAAALIPNPNTNFNPKLDPPNKSLNRTGVGDNDISTHVGSNAGKRSEGSVAKKFVGGSEGLAGKGDAGGSVAEEPGSDGLSGTVRVGHSVGERAAGGSEGIMVAGDVGKETQGLQGEKGREYGSREGKKIDDNISGDPIGEGWEEVNNRKHNGHMKKGRQEQSQKGGRRDFTAWRQNRWKATGWATGESSRAGEGKNLGGIVKSNNEPKVQLSFNTNKVSTWADMVIGRTRVIEERRKLQYFQPDFINNRKTAAIQSTTMTKVAEKWVNSILLYVVGPRPYYMYFKAFAKRTWKPKGDFEIFSRDNGFYLVKFILKEDCDNVLNGGPYFFDGRVMIMKKWTNELKLDRDMLLSIPLWVRLPDIPINLLEEEALSRIGSVIGKPIEMDNTTAHQKRISFARMLVEVDASHGQITSVPIRLVDGTIYNQKILYEWSPPMCTRCVCFGHTIIQCPMKSIWKEKENHTEERAANEGIGKANVVDNKEMADDKEVCDANIMPTETTHTLLDEELRNVDSNENCLEEGIDVFSDDDARVDGLEVEYKGGLLTANEEHVLEQLFNENTPTEQGLHKIDNDTGINQIAHEQSPFQLGRIILPEVILQSLASTKNKGLQILSQNKRDIAELSGLLTGDIDDNGDSCTQPVATKPCSSHEVSVRQDSDIYKQGLSHPDLNEDAPPVIQALLSGAVGTEAAVQPTLSSSSLSTNNSLQLLELDNSISNNIVSNLQGQTAPTESQAASSTKDADINSLALTSSRHLDGSKHPLVQDNPAWKGKSQKITYDYRVAHDDNASGLRRSSRFSKV